MVFDVIIDDPIAAAVTQLSNTIPGGGATVTGISNQGTITSNELADFATDDPDDATGSSDPTSTPITAAPILSATKVDALTNDADGDGNISPGDTITYTVVITNTGDQAASGVSFADTPDANTALTVGSVTTTQGAITSGNTAGDSTVGVSLGTIPGGGASATVVFDVIIDDPIAAGASDISNQGTITSNELADFATDDPDDATGSSDPTSTPITAAPDVSATKTAALQADADADGNVDPGDTVRYTITLTNDGDEGAANLAVTDPVPANTTLDAVVSTPTGSTDDSTATNIDVNSFSLAGGGATTSVVFDVIVDDPIAAGVTQLSNTATVTGTGIGPLTVGPETTPITAEPDVSATKTAALQADADADGNVDPGDTVRYTITLTNDGDEGAANLAVTDPVPANTTLDAVVSTPTGSTDDSTATDIDVNSFSLAGGGATTSVVFDVIVDDPIAAGVTQLSNTATVTGTGIGPLTVGPETTPITAAPILSATKVDALTNDADGDGNISPGDTITYTVVITNTGDQAASGVSFADTPDANTALTVGSVTTTQGAITSGNTAGDSTVGVSLGTIPGGGASATVVFDVIIDDPIAAGASDISNQGTITSNELADFATDDPDDATGSSDPTSTPITAAPILSATKVDALTNDADGDGNISPGDTITYTVVITNTGDQAASGVSFADTPDANTALTVGSVTTTQGAITSGNTAGDSTVGVSLGTIPGGGASATVVFDVIIDDPIAAGASDISNQGTITSNELADFATDDPDDATGSSDPTSTPITAAPDVSATKTAALQADADADGNVDPGDTVRYNHHLDQRWG